MIETEDSDKEEVRRVKVKGEEERMDYTDSREPEGENKKSKKENTEKKKTADQLPAKMRKKAIATRGAGKVNRWYWWLVDHPTQLICIWIFIGPR